MIIRLPLHGMKKSRSHSTELTRQCRTGSSEKSTDCAVLHGPTVQDVHSRVRENFIINYYYFPGKNHLHDILYKRSLKKMMGYFWRFRLN